MSDQKIPVRWCRWPDTGGRLYGASGRNGGLETASNLHSLAWALHASLDRLGKPVEDPTLFEEYLGSERQLSA